MSRHDRKPLLHQQAEWFRLTEAGAIGMEMGIAVAIGFFGGRWLERNVTHWSPWTTYLGLAAGIGAAVVAIVRTARKFSRQLAAEEARGQSHDSEAAPPRDSPDNPPGNPPGAP